jgi:hypothetical protein
VKVHPFSPEEVAKSIKDLLSAPDNAVRRNRGYKLGDSAPV